MADEKTGETFEIEGEEAVDAAVQAVSLAASELRNRIVRDAQRIGKLAARVLEQEQEVGWKAKANADIVEAQGKVTELVEQHKLALLDLRAGLEVAAKALIEGVTEMPVAKTADDLNAQVTALVQAALNPLVDTINEALTALNHRPR